MPEVEEGVPEADTSSSLISAVISDIIYSPLNLALLTICVILLYKIFSGRKPEEISAPPVPQIPPLKKQDMTLEQLRKYDGHDEDGRVCIAVNGKIFDVTKGKKFYGPGGPYQAFAGRDATRGLATFSVDVTKDEYDDLSDLNSMQMEGVKEWEMQFTEKYHYVGRLLKPGEEPTDYSDDEETSQEQGTTEKETKTDSDKKEN